ncbi:MAG TPA: helix-turn-helix domain-containing protein [Candidatus Methanoperedens sp.]
MEIQERLKMLGLNAYETRAYIALLSLGTADANEISARTRIPRGRIYDALNSLVENNLAELQESRPKKFQAVTPKIALKNLIEKKKKEYERKSRQLNRLVSEIESTMTEMMTNADSNVFWIVTRNDRESADLLVNSLAEAKNEYLSYLVLEEKYSVSDEKIFLNRMVCNEIIRMLHRNVNMMFLLPERDIKPLLSHLDGDFISKVIPFIGKNMLIRTVDDVYTPIDVVDNEKVNIIVKNPSIPGQYLAAISFLDKDLANTLKKEFLVLWKKAKPLDQGMFITAFKESSGINGERI